MNKNITRLLLGALSLAFPSLVSAADLVVGPGRTYVTISDAIAAAADGDRILVKPKTALYAESPVITKSLTILSADEGQYFKCGGTWTFSPSAAGKVLTIIGLHLVGGDVTSAANAPAGARSQIRLLGSVLYGRLNFFWNNFDVTAAGDSVMGEVNLQYGKVMGNYISANGYSEAVEVGSDATPSTDSVWVVGNRIHGGAAVASNSPAVRLNSATQYVFCTNNLLYIGQYNSSSYGYNTFGIYLSSTLNTGTGKNSIVNNTIYNYNQYGYGWYSGRYGILINNAPDNLLVNNNLLLGATPSYSGNGIVQNAGSSLYSLSYNYLRGNYNINAVAASNGVGNKLNSNTTLASDGTPVAGADAINGGAPDDEYLDADLTRNDAGCYGGSLSLANFPAVGPTAANNNNLGARVYFFQAPRVLMQGQPVKVKASGFDR